VSGRRARLRQRVGFGLVEAGLHVLATTRSAPCQPTPSTSAVTWPRS
jgi:hypothetical protein